MIELRSPNSAKQKHIVLIPVKFIFHVLSYQRVTYLFPNISDFDSFPV